jgi:hypothetical protein
LKIQTDTPPSLHQARNQIPQKQGLPILGARDNERRVKEMYVIHKCALSTHAHTKYVALLGAFNQAIYGVNNQKARQNPKALAQLDGYNRPLVGISG